MTMKRELSMGKSTNYIRGLIGMYPMVNVYIILVNHDWKGVNQLFLWPCSIVFCCLPEGITIHWGLPGLNTTLGIG